MCFANVSIVAISIGLPDVGVNNPVPASQV